MKLIKLKIPFITKKYIKNQKGLKIKGNAFYIFDLNTMKIVDQYIEIIDGNYRLTDANMLKTKYYKKFLFKNFRDKYLDNFTRVNATCIKDSQFVELNKEQLNKINLEFKQMNTTTRNMFACLSGSNPSGAVKYNHSTNMICNDAEFFKCNFANPLKFFEANKNNKLKIDNDESLEEYNIKEFIEMSQEFKNMFFKFNKQHEFSGIVPTILEINSYIENYEKAINKNKYTISEKQSLFIQSIVNKTFSNDLNKNVLIKKLRGFYQSNIHDCLKNNQIPLHSTTIKCDLSQVENAHIISFSELIKKETYKDLYSAIDPYNCLRIDSSMHKLWDKNKFDFDEKGNVVFRDGKIKENYLDMNLLPEPTMNYFKKYLSNIRRIK